MKKAKRQKTIKKAPASEKPQEINLPWPPRLAPTRLRRKWFAKFTALPPGLDRVEIGKRLRTSYAVVLRYVNLFGYQAKRKTGSGYWKRSPMVDWENVDWTQKDADISRVLNVSRERVRQVRSARGLPPSPRGSRNRHNFTKFLQANKESLQGLPMSAIVARSGIPLSYSMMREVIRRFGLDAPPNRQWTTRLNWRLPDGDLAKIWKIPVATIRTARKRDKFGPPRWEQATDDYSPVDHQHWHAFRNERVKSRRFVREVSKGARKS